MRIRRPFRLRWRFRTSLRVLLAVVTVMAIWLGWFGTRAREQAAAVAAIEAAGGRVIYDFEPDPDERARRELLIAVARTNGVPKPVFEDAPRAPEWLRELVGQHYFVTAVEVDFPDACAGDECLRALAQLPELRALFVGETFQCRITNAGLELLADRSELRILRLSGYDITDEGLVHLHGLDQLETIDLQGANVTWKGVARLEAALPDATVLHGLPGEPMVRQEGKTAY